MSLYTSNNRQLLKRSTVAGVVPTIPGSGATDVYNHTAGGWLATDLYDGEMFANTTDNKLWVRSGSNLLLLGYSGLTSSFLNLTDTPNSYAGAGGLAVFVNPGASGLTFSAISTVTSSTELIDMPSTLAGYSGYVLTVNGGETGYELTVGQKTFTGLTDVNVSAYTEGDLIKISSGLLTNFDPTTQFVDLKTLAQSITAAKEWDSIQNFNQGINLVQPFNFTGITEYVTIDNIVTSIDSSFSGASDSELASTLAIRNYVTAEIFAAAGSTAYTGNFVTVDTNQSITGYKTFDDAYVNVFTAKTETVGNITVETDLTLAETSYQYFGNPGVAGCFRIYVNPVGNLCIEKLLSGGTWEFRADF